MASKWPAYYFLTPWEATKRFYDVYCQHVRRFVREHVDAGLEDRVAKASFESVVGRPGEFTQLWKARQRADQFPVPYEIYIEFSMFFWSRRSGPGRSGAPRPNQLGWTDASAHAWLNMFEHFLEDRMPLVLPSLAEVPEFCVAAYQGTPEQIVVRELILEACSTSSSSWPRLIRDWCCERQMLRPLHFRNLMPKDTLRDAIRSVRAERVHSRRTMEISSVGLRPSCHGIASSRGPDSSRCLSCREAGSCEAMSDLVLRMVEVRTGHADPRRQAKRHAPNARQAKYRARRKAVALP